MRLKIQHKEDLYNLIKGKLRPNLTVSFEEAEKYINEKIYAIFPPEWKKVDDYITTFVIDTPEIDYFPREYLTQLPFINDKGHLEYKGVRTQMPSLITTINWVKNYGFPIENSRMSHYSRTTKPLTLEHKLAGEVKDTSVIDWFNDNFINPMIEFDKVCRELQSTIYSCSTDKKLKEMYPEFEKYFTTVGIVPTVSKVPAIYGLPDKLKKFGYKG